MAADGFAAFRAKARASAEAAAATGAGPTCAACLAFHSVGGEPAPATGECRRYAPIPQTPEQRAVWPLVAAGEWCMQHRRNAAPFTLTFVDSPAALDPKGFDDD